MIKINKKILAIEIKKMMDEFSKKYGLREDQDDFFNEVLPLFAEKLKIENIGRENLEKMTWEFVEEYRDVRSLGGYNATYGNLYHWFIEFACAIRRVDSYEFFYSKK